MARRINMNTNNIITQPSQRLRSLDFMRGLIMVLLMMEGAGFYERFHEATSGDFLNAFLTQFSHHPWHGLRFWD